MTDLSSNSNSKEFSYDEMYPDNLHGVHAHKQKLPLSDRFVEIVPNLLLASAAAAGDFDFIPEWNITHVLHVGVRPIDYKDKKIIQHAIIMQDEDIPIDKILMDQGGI
jgi:hypothetical protein